MDDSPALTQATLCAVLPDTLCENKDFMASKIAIGWPLNFFFKGNNFWYIHNIEYYLQLKVTLTEFILTHTKKCLQHIKQNTNARQKLEKSNC